MLDENLVAPTLVEHLEQFSYAVSALPGLDFSAFVAVEVGPAFRLGGQLGPEEEGDFVVDNGHADEFAALINAFFLWKIAGDLELGPGQVANDTNLVQVAAPTVVVLEFFADPIVGLKDEVAALLFF